jgi:hypothetical protein
MCKQAERACGRHDQQHHRNRKAAPQSHNESSRMDAQPIPARIGNGRHFFGGAFR